MRKSLLVTALALALVAICFGVSEAQIGAITIESVNGLYATDTIEVGTPVEFIFRITNTLSQTVAGSANGFRIYSPDGASWTPGIFVDTTIRTIPPPASTTYDTTLYGAFVDPPSYGGVLVWIGGNNSTTFSIYDGGIFVNSFSTDGIGADTVGFAGFNQTTGSGIFPTFDDIGWKIRLESIDASSHGKTICVDSSYYPPAGTWKWSMADVSEYFAAWNGPFCYTIYDPNAPSEFIPVITCPSTGITQQICGPEQICISVPVADLGSGTVTSTAGGTWTNGQLCYNFNATTQTTDMVIASNTAGADTCFININVTLGTSASITSCPGPIVQDLCGAGLVCAPITITNATSVTSSAGGTYSAGNNEICYPINTTKTFTDTVIAVGDCGSDTCFISVTATIGAPALITSCPAPIVQNICGPQTICVPLSVTDADSVTSTQGGTYDAGLVRICWNVTSSIAVTDTIVAWSACGNDTCIVDVTVTVTPSAAITCPTSPLAMDICAPQAICQSLPVINADSVTSTQGGTWFNNEICWDVPGSINVVDTVVAWSNCANDTCIIPLTVTLIPVPNIVPTELAPDVFVVCGAQNICIELPISDATTVTSSQGGTWANDTLCWNVSGDLNVVDTVLAANACGVDSCFINVQVTFAPKASITCPETPIVTSICSPSQICDGLPVTDADSVTTKVGTWSNDQICWTINATTSFVDTVVAWSFCGNDTCYIPVTVNLDKNLVVTPDTLYFTVVEGDANTHTQKFAVDDDAECGIAYSAAETSALFSAIPGTGTTPDSLAIDVVIGATGVSTTVEMVEISSPDALNSPVIRYVSVTVTDKPNTPPTISAIADTTFDECGSVSLPVSASDVDGDPLSLWLVPGNVPNATLTDNGDGTGTFDFVPDFTQAGVYPFTIWVSDGTDSASASFTVTINDCLPGERNDIHIAGVSAVPGSRFEVPVNFTNLCDLSRLTATIGWTTDSLYLDSASFVGSRVAGYSALSATIDNVAHTVQFDLTVQLFEGNVPPDSGLLATLHFSSRAFTPGGTYDFDLVGSPEFDLDCGQGTQTETPFFFPGFVIIDDAPSGGYTCGYVVDDQGNGIPGAVVELWQDYPCFGPDFITTTNSFGAYAFEGFGFGTFDIYAYTTDSTYYNDAVEGNNFGDLGIQPVLLPLIPILTTDLSAFWASDCAYLRTCLAPIGSVVEVQDIDGTICGRGFVTDQAGFFKFIAVYQDDPTTLEDEGAVNPETIKFYINGVPALTAAPVVYPVVTPGGNMPRDTVCLDAGAVVTQTCELDDDWNLISWNLDTESDVITDVFQSLLASNCVEVIIGFEQGGLAYDPMLEEFSTLWDVDHLSGYWVKIKPGCEAALEVSGLEVDENTPITVTTGWNLVSYLPTDNRAPEDALCSIIDDLEIAYGFDVSTGVDVFKPGAGGLNDLTSMSSCYGYWLKLQDNGILDYTGCPGTLTSPKVTQTVRHALAAPDDVNVTTSWINAYARNLTVNGQQVKAGAQITAHNSVGEKVGYFRMTQNGKFGFMAVYADDAGSDGTAGLRPGEDFYLAVDENPTNEFFQWTENGDRVEIGALTAKGTSGGSLPDTYGLSQNYPNPFNPTTNINFTLPTTGIAKIEVYNMLGKLVATPFDGIAEAGENVVVWDARDSEGRRVASGIYFYRLTADSFSATRKMTLLK